MVDSTSDGRPSGGLGDDTGRPDPRARDERPYGLCARVARPGVDVTDYPEISDLYLASDVAVVDYSSLRFDFASPASR